LWWHNRNKANAGDTTKLNDEISFSVKHQLANVMNNVQINKDARQQSAPRWAPPQEGILKINTDGAFWAENHTGGWGFTIRNEQGMLMAAGAGQLEHVSDALHSEGLAMLHVVHAAFQLGCNRIMVETDSIVLKQVVTTNAYDLPSWVPSLATSTFSLGLGFSDVSVSHYERLCNQATHTLAVHVIVMYAGTCEVWLGQFPNFV
jgi:hypothetical protein